VVNKAKAQVAALEGCSILMIDSPSDWRGGEAVPFGQMNATVREAMLRLNDEE